VLVTPDVSGGLWDVGYEKMSGENKLVIRGRVFRDPLFIIHDSTPEVSYRLTGKRFDWRQHPTKTIINGEPSLIIP